MTDFEQLHIKSLESIKDYYKKDYSTNKEDIEKKAMTIIKSQGFIKNHMINIGFEFEEINYKFLYD